MTTEENALAKARMQALLAGYAKAMPATNFDMPFTINIDVLTATVDCPPNTTSKSTFSFVIPEIYVNNPGPGREIHGGAIATFFDNITTTALLGCKDYWGQCVSRNLNIMYFRPSRAGEKVVVEMEVVQMGKRFVTVQGVMKRESDGVVLARCVHDKVRVGDGGSKASSLEKL